MVVDQDAASLSLTAEALHSFAPGFDVATANDAGQAIAWLETFHPDILLMSQSFAVSDEGILAARVRGDERTRHCKIIVVSDADPGEDKVGLRSDGADATLVKPLNLPLLLQTVRKVLDH
jgi:DNA-binding response OmpR family regulator